MYHHRVMAWIKKYNRDYLGEKKKPQKRKRGKSEIGPMKGNLENRERMAQWGEREEERARLMMAISKVAIKGNGAFSLVESRPSRRMGRDLFNLVTFREESRKVRARLSPGSSFYLSAVFLRKIVFLSFRGAKREPYKMVIGQVENKARTQGAPG